MILKFRRVGMVAWFILSLALFILCTAQADEFPSFQNWLEALKEEALARGISQVTLDQTLSHIEPIPRIIELDKNQPEFALTLKDYLKTVVSEARVREGHEKWMEQRSLLNKIFRQYGVSPRFLVALWGVESRYGQLNGRYPVITALATLAYQGRRSVFFRKELFEALYMVDRGHVARETMNGSWAGAMGQFQFMPSSIRRFGVDFDGDGRVDIIKTYADAFASAANYLVQCGWKSDQTWGREVRLPQSFNRRWIGLGTQKQLSRWRILGIRDIDGRPLPRKPNLTASLIEPQGAGGPTYLVYHNYSVLLKWNRSHLFGLAVGILADHLDAD